MTKTDAETELELGSHTSSGLAREVVVVTGTAAYINDAMHLRCIYAHLHMHPLTVHPRSAHRVILPILTFGDTLAGLSIHVHARLTQPRRRGAAGSEEMIRRFDGIDDLWDLDALRKLQKTSWGLRLQWHE
jgi:hypothetical protein